MNRHVYGGEVILFLWLNEEEEGATQEEEEVGREEREGGRQRERKEGEK